MRRRCLALPAPAPVEPAKKKCKGVAQEVLEPSDLDVSFFDDEALPPGLVMTDISQRKWRIGKPIGRGSFGRIYLASNDVNAEVTKQNARYVVKIEPHTNGPLFVEIHCLIRTAKAALVKKWRSDHKQKSIGMPVYIASGSFTDDTTGTRYRFLVLPRYEVDLQKMIARKGRVLDLKNILVLAIQILDVLEYLHKEGYTHSDIKSSNLMLGFDGMKFGKMPASPSTFLKEVHRVSSLKQKVKQNRASNYYNDEDFVMKMRSDDEGPVVRERKMNNVRNKIRKTLSDRSSRNLHRYHAFNLRQLSNHVNYEDFNSSICSDESYQRLIDENESKYSSDEGFYDEPRFRFPEISENWDNDEVFSEAILSQSSGQIYLLDYGLATKFLDSNGVHKEFGMDARKAHDGTLEYSSRDSHIGAHSRRSDLETLGFNLLDWLTGTLPWKTTEMLAEPDLVHALKKNYMEDVKALLRTCFKTEFYPDFMEKYLLYVRSLEFTVKPDYDYCRNIFKAEFMRNGFGSEKDMRLCLSEALILPINRKKIIYSKRFGHTMKTPSVDFIARKGIIYGRENIQSLENDLKFELLKKTLNSSNDGIRKPCASRNFFISDADLVAKLKQSLLPLENLGKKLSPKNLRSKKRLIQKKRGKRAKRNSIGKFGNFLGSGRQFSWAEILAGKPEHMIMAVRKEKNLNDDEEDSNKSRNRKVSNASETSAHIEQNSQSPLLNKNYLQELNPTYAMKEIFNNFRKKLSNKKAKEQLSTEDPNLKGYTPAMVKVLRSKEKRENKEKAQELKERQLQNKKQGAINAVELKAKNVPKKSTTVNTVRNKREYEQKATNARKNAVAVSAVEAKRAVKSTPSVVTPLKKIARMTRSEANKKNSVECKRKPVVRLENVTEVEWKPTKHSKKPLRKPASNENSTKSAVANETPKSAKKTKRKISVVVNRRITRSSRRNRK